MKTLIRVLILFALALLAYDLKAQAVGTPVPIVVMLTARDENGTALYHRKAYIFLGPIEEYGVPENYLPFSDGVGIIRLLREQGERCNDVLPIVREAGDTLTDYCRPQAPRVKP